MVHIEATKSVIKVITRTKKWKVDHLSLGQMAGITGPFGGLQEQ